MGKASIICGVYKIYWLNCQYFYYGQARDFRNRRKDHLSRLRRNIHCNNFLQKVFNKYGEPEIDVIEVCEEPLLCDREQVYISKSYSSKYSCNINPTANGSTLSEKTKSKISIARSGKLLSEKHKKSISEGLKVAYKNGRLTHLVNTKGKDNPFYGKRHNEETRSRMKMKKAGMYLGSSNPKARKVIDTSTGVIYNSIMDASNARGILLSQLYKKLSGYRKNNTGIIYYDPTQRLPE